MTSLGEALAPKTSERASSKILLPAPVSPVMTVRPGPKSTPAVADGKVHFVAFNGKMYCLDQGTLEAVWITDLRCADPLHNQPVTNTLGMDQGYAPVAGWSSPLVVNDRVYTGIGEGENPFAYSFVYCLDAATGEERLLAPERLGPERHDALAVEDGPALAGVVATSRRVGGTRRVELEIGGQQDLVEIDLPFDHPAGLKSRLAFRPKRWRLFPA